MLQPRHLISTLDRSHRFVRWSILLTILLSVAMYFTLDRPIHMAISIAFFLLGWILAHAIFIQEAWIVTRVDKLVDRGLESLPPINGLAEAEPQRDETPKSVLKQGIIIIIMPVLAFFLLTSTRSAVGLGLIWGVMSVYAYDMMSFLLEKNPEIVDPYFGALTNSPQTLRNTSIGYLVFVFLFAMLLFAARFALV
jgi:hypothetical protein